MRTYVRDSAGLSFARYRRALERRHIFGAEIAAREMGYVSLRDALGLLALYAAEDSPKYDKAATRWLARLALETDDLQLRDTQLAAAALQALPFAPRLGAARAEGAVELIRASRVGYRKRFTSCSIRSAATPDS